MDLSQTLLELPDCGHSPHIAGGVTVITLAHQNPAQLQATLAALPAAVAGLPWPWHVLVLDGSEDEACALVARAQASALNLPLHYVRQPARGIYAAMNDALALADGALVAFMHAGDHYLPGGLTALVAHWHTLLQPDSPLPAAVFGQAWVQPGSASRVAAWLTPDPAMRRLQRWLRGMVPCHQAFVFERGFARAHPYATGSLVADRLVMRAALGATGPGAYLRQPVCVYDLGGVSSTLPAGAELWRRLWEPQRTGLERAAELAKALMRPLAVSVYPALMRFRSRIWGLYCSL